MNTKELLDATIHHVENLRTTSPEQSQECDDIIEEIRSLYLLCVPSTDSIVLARMECLSPIIDDIAIRAYSFVHGDTLAPDTERTPII